MQVRSIFLFKKIIIFLIFLAPFLSFTQNNIIEKVLDTTSVVKPVAIPMTNVVKKIEESNVELEKIESRIKRISSIKEIDSLLPEYISYIKKQKKQTQAYIKGNPNKQKITYLIKNWENYYLHFENWENTISKQEDDYAIFIEKGEFMEQTWNLTYKAAVSEKIPYEVLNNIKRIWFRIKKVQKTIFNQKNKLLSLESKVNKQKTYVNNVIEELSDLKKSEVYNVFHLRHQPLWKTSFQSEDDIEIEKVLMETVPKKLTGVFSLIINNENGIYLFLITIVLIILLFRFLKKTYRNHSFNEQDKDLQNAKDVVLNHSVSSIVYMSLFVAYFFFKAAPILLIQILLLMILIASVPLVQPFIFKRFKKVIYAIILLFIFDIIKSYVWFSPVQYRFYLILEAVFLIILLFVFTYPYQKTRKMKIGNFGLFLIRVTPVLYFMGIISIVSNILGYTNLAEMAIRISVHSAVITVVFYGYLMISGGVVIGLIHNHFSKRESFDPDLKFKIEKRALTAIRVVVLIYWIFFFLNMIDLWAPLTEYLTIKFSAPLQIGTVTFTIGSILIFILILTISFLITSFISFTLDGETLKFLKLPKGIPSAISLVIRYFIIGFGFVLALSSLGIDLGKFNLMAGALGLGIGFGLQTVISNFVSGLILVFERPILPGDTVEVNNLLGTVKRIGVRSSTISTFDGAEVVVPNNNLIADDLINWTLSDNIKRVEILIGTTYGSNPNEILKILSDIASENNDVLKDPPPQVLFSDFGDSSLNFQLRFWVSYEIGLQVKSDVSIAVYNKFKELGIEIPFPQQDIYIKDMPVQLKKTTALVKPEKKENISNKKSNQIIEPLPGDATSGEDQDL